MGLFIAIQIAGKLKQMYAYLNLQIYSMLNFEFCKKKYLNYIIIYSFMNKSLRKLQPAVNLAMPQNKRDIYKN